MRRSLLVLLGLTLLPAAAAAGPLADPAPWVLPVNAFAKARPGDWTVLEGDTIRNGKPVHEREVIRVSAVAGGVAEVQLHEGAIGRERWFLTFPVDMKRGPDTNLLHDVPWIATDLRTSKATCALGDTTLACTVVTYKTPSATVTVFMSPRVRGSGIVSFEVVRGGTTVWSMATTGYGTAGKSEWGVAPPGPELEAPWDASQLAVGLREGSQPATDDVYEPEELPALGLPPRADLTGCEVTGDRDRRLVRRFVLRTLARVEDCYVAALVRKPKLGGGTVEVGFTIDELAAPVELTTAGTADPALRTCVSDLVTRLQFAYSDAGGSSLVTCTFTFDPGKPAPPRKKLRPRKLLVKGHPARGGPDLRGVTRTVTRAP